VTQPAQELADLLTGLKIRSGRSYESIGRRISASKSTVHRYCTAATVPQEFGVLERIAITCGACRDEIVRLHQLWIRATADDAAASANNAAPAPAPRPHAAPVEKPRTAAPLVRQTVVPPRRPVALLLVRVGVVISLVVAVTSSTPRPGSDSPSLPPRQLVSGPAWMLPAAPVPSTLFGVTINSSTGLMPTFRVGAVRLWDDGTRWSEIQAQRDEFDWSVLDRQVNGAANLGLPALFVFGGTPRWASPHGPPGPYPDGSTPAPPDDTTDWNEYVHAVVERYRGRIEAYELWVLANDPRFYAGSVETLVDMTRSASQIIRSVDPKATVVCPGMGRLWTMAGVRFLERFAELGGYSYCDVAGIKLFQKSAADPPETMLTLIANVDRTMHKVGLQPRLWNTGTTYDIPLQAPLNETLARDYAVRFYLVGLYSRETNVERMYFYNWGGTRIPIVLQAVGGAPTGAALAVEQLQRWLAHAESQSCGHGVTAGLPNNAWECRFSVEEPTRTYDARIQWTNAGNAVVTAGPGAQAVHHLDGSATAIQPADTILLTEEPVLVEYRTENGG
jgi:hypothetical protein